MAESGARVVRVRVLARPKKLDLARRIADRLGLEAPSESSGSSIDSTFLDRVHRALSRDGRTGANTYEKIAQIMGDLGLEPDPARDTSALAPTTGGGTVTTRAFSRVSVAVSGEPRCFLVAVDDGSSLEAIEQERSFEYEGEAEGRLALTEAGPETRVLFCTRGDDQTLKPRLSTIVRNIDGRRTERHRMTFERLAWLTPPVFLVLEGRSESDFAEISFASFRAALSIDEAPDLGDPPQASPYPGVRPALAVPDALPEGLLSLRDADSPTYEFGHDDVLRTRDLPTRSRDRGRMRAVEVRAVEIALRALRADGWSLERDRQADGVGYDFEVSKGPRLLHIEVKGIAGSRLAFDVTPKEAARAEVDPLFVVVAVTRALSDDDYRVHLLTRERLAIASRFITGYRMSFSPPR